VKVYVLTVVDRLKVSGIVAGPVRAPVTLCGVIGVPTLYGHVLCPSAISANILSLPPTGILVLDVVNVQVTVALTTTTKS
jgi:hypothetical protein